LNLIQSLRHLKLNIQQNDKRIVPNVFQLKLEPIWEFGYMSFYLSIFVLRLNYTNSDIDEISEKLDEEFETMESIIKNALEIVEEYEKQIESSKINQ
jgi:hypothetical protein